MFPYQVYYIKLCCKTTKHVHQNVLNMVFKSSNMIVVYTLLTKLHILVTSNQYYFSNSTITINTVTGNDIDMDASNMFSCELILTDQTRRTVTSERVYIHLDTRRTMMTRKTGTRILSTFTFTKHKINSLQTRTGHNEEF